MSTDKYDVLFVRLNGKNYSAWAFQFQIFVKGKELWGHVDGTDAAPDKAQKDAHAKWEVKDAQVMAWIIGSVDPSIVLNLRPFTTAAKMWDYLQKYTVKTTLLGGSNLNMKSPFFNRKVSQFLSSILIL